MPKQKTQLSKSAEVPARALAGVAAIVALTLFGALNFYQFLSGYGRANPDPYQIGAQQERLRGALAALPADTKLGYLSDQPLGEAQGSAFFFATSYLAAPRLLVPYRKEAPTAWVLGNFVTPTDTARVAAEHGLTVATDYGNGIVLFRRNSR